jgi:peptidoglycan hydrolase FlgJ
MLRKSKKFEAIMDPINSSRTDSAPVQARAKEAELREAAIKLEASFLAEMLKSTGMGKSRGAFGGGSGEDQFSSFLVRAQADQMARAGGIGLAESFFDALVETYNDE